MRPVYLHSVGLWTPGYADAEAWCRGEADPGAVEPAAGLLVGALRRRASALSRMACEALQQAVEGAGASPERTPSIWVTVHGEHETAVAILDMMRRGEGRVSPTRFHNSVHNTPSGYASIATGNRQPSTTLTGGSEVLASALLEAICQLEAGASDVALVLADEPLRPPFDARGALAPLAVAFGLSSRAAGARAALAGLRRDAVSPVKRREPFGALYVAAALPLLERAVLGRPGTVALELEGGADGPVWCVDLELASGATVRPQPFAMLPPPRGRNRRGDER
jgi:hypothetical protein